MPTFNTTSIRKLEAAIADYNRQVINVHIKGEMHVDEGDGVDARAWKDHNEYVKAQAWLAGARNSPYHLKVYDSVTPWPDAPSNVSPYRHETFEENFDGDVFRSVILTSGPAGDIQTDAQGQIAADSEALQGAEALCYACGMAFIPECFQAGGDQNLTEHIEGMCKAHENNIPNLMGMVEPVTREGAKEIRLTLGRKGAAREMWWFDPVAGILPDRLRIPGRN